MPTMSTTILCTWYQYQDPWKAALASDLGVDLGRDSLPRLVACML
jgi:hypothetical protein